MNEELEIFLEDCDDQLQMMENALVEMQSAEATEENIGAIFRAVHTIKGSAGMFGFEDIVTFTHTGENLFDVIRQGELTISSEMVSLFLLCKDYIEKLIDSAVNDEDLSEEENQLGKELIESLLSFIPSSENTQKKEVFLEEEKKEKPLLNKWHISIRFNKDFFTTGMSIHSIFNFLNSMGSVLINAPIIYKIPLLKNLDPIFPYIGFEILYEGTQSQEALEDVFEFIQEDVSLVIFEAKNLEEYELLLQIREEDLLQEELIRYSFITPKVTQVDIPEPLKIHEKEELILNKELKNDVTIQTTKKSSASLRVDSQKIDILINYMSEIVIANSKILALVSSDEEEEEEEESELQEAAQNMKQLLEYVRDGIMDIRMVQVGDSFNKFRRIVNDTSKKIGKDVEFIISGEETELDKTVIERISDPLLHMLRNSIDHGIELPKEREKSGKSPRGRVDLRAYPDAGSIVIEIEDDGKGLDKEKILTKAVSNGLVNENANLSDEEIYKLIFTAGLSTADKVSDISGRGVGMDVVKRNIEDLRGSIDIESVLGQGSKITIRLPLTLAIIDGFLVQVGTTKYIIPLENIKECIELTETQELEMGENEFINLRGEMLPLLDIRELLQEDGSLTSRKNIVIVYFANRSVGLLVDELLDEYQTVIKSLGAVFNNLSGISGGSILGSGEIALIFDIPRLIEMEKLKGRVIDDK